MSACSGTVLPLSFTEEIQILAGVSVAVNVKGLEAGLAFSWLWNSFSLNLLSLLYPTNGISVIDLDLYVRSQEHSKSEAGNLSFASYLQLWITCQFFRYGCFLDLTKHITHNEGGLDKFTRGHEYYGVHRLPDNSIVVREWAPGTQGIYLKGDFSELSYVSLILHLLMHLWFCLHLKGDFSEFSYVSLILFASQGRFQWVFIFVFDLVCISREILMRFHMFLWLCLYLKGDFSEFSYVSLILFVSQGRFQ